MKHNILLTLILSLFLTLAVLGQTKESRIDNFLGKSKATIQKVWGYPDKTEITQQGYVMWTYNVKGNIKRDFYFSGDYVEMAGSVIVFDNFSYAKQFAADLGASFRSNGFWLLRENGDTDTYTNGQAYLDIAIISYKGYYAFSLLAYW